MQTRRGGGDAQVLERTQFRGVPAMVNRPAHGDHVVGAVRVAEFLWTAGFGDRAEGGCIGGFDGGGVEVCGGGCDGAHGGGYSSYRWSMALRKMCVCARRGEERRRHKRREKNESIENLYPVDTPAAPRF